MSIAFTIEEILKNEIPDYEAGNQKVTVREHVNGTFELDYYTTWYDDYSDTLGVLPIFQIISRSEYSRGLSKLEITAEDEGVNGTQGWELRSMLDNEVQYPQLETFILPLNETGTHNRRIVTLNDSYDENNGLALLLDKAPKLKKLVAPSAPGEHFFNRETHGLETLILQTGYTHQGFIRNLASSECFQQLSLLQFRDYAETYMNDYKGLCVRFEDYQLLMESESLPALKTIVLQDTLMDAGQQGTLIALASAKGRALRFEQLFL